MASFPFTLVSPERMLFQGSVESVILPGTEGEMQIMAGHAPLVAALRCGLVFAAEPATGHEFFITGGIAEIGPTGLTVLADRANLVGDVTPASLDAEILTLQTHRDGSRDEAVRMRADEQLQQLQEFRGVFEGRRAA